MGVGDVHAGFRVEPAVVALGEVALGCEPIGDFLDCRLGAVDVGLGDDEGRALLGREDAVEPDVVTEDPVAGNDVAQVGDAALRTEIGREGELYDPLEFLD